MLERAARTSKSANPIHEVKRRAGKLAFSILLCGATWLASHTAAHAAPITYEFGGTIDALRVSPELGEYGIVGGTAFVGRISFDPDAEPNGVSSAFRLAEWTGVSFEVSLIGTGIRFTSSTPRIGLVDNDPFNPDVDGIDFGFDSPYEVEGLPPSVQLLTVGFSLQDPSGAAFDGFARLPQTLNLADFAFRDFSLIALVEGVDDVLGAGGEVTRLTPVQVSEPGTAALFLSALAGVLALSRARSGAHGRASIAR